jgi:hypothetical protein
LRGASGAAGGAFRGHSLPASRHHPAGPLPRKDPANAVKRRMAASAHDFSTTWLGCSIGNQATHRGISQAAGPSGGPGCYAGSPAGAARISGLTGKGCYVIQGAAGREWDKFLAHNEAKSQFDLEMFKSVLEAGKSALQTLIVINGYLRPQLGSVHEYGGQERDQRGAQ